MMVLVAVGCIMLNKFRLCLAVVHSCGSAKAFLIGFHGIRIKNIIFYTELIIISIFEIIYMQTKFSKTIH